MYATLLVLCISWHAKADTNTHTNKQPGGPVIFSDAPIKNGTVQRNSYTPKAYGIKSPGKTTKPQLAKAQKKVVRNPCKGLSRKDLDARAKWLKPKFERASKITGVEVSLLMAVARAESCFDTKVESRVGAKGLMQLMPPTAKAMGVANIYSSWQNIAGGASYLALMLKRYSNDVDLALAAYNAGPGNVARYKGVPPFRETQRYIVSVNKHLKYYRIMNGVSTQVATADD